MTRVGRPGASNVYDIGEPPSSNSHSWNLSTPAGWAAVWWGLSVLIIIAMFLML